ncbi:FAD-dependent monooxygenase [Streptomyces parvus]|uniref:FAD-dependent monooxygenase n=1 Tax=Streptomyces parvus TaxID=66428 RepID=UPI003D763BC8
MGVRHAVVAGGGIGGLTAAVALSRRGWRVTVCERASALTGIGAGIVLAPNALRALESIGLGPAVSAGEPLAGVLGLRTPDGAWLSRTGVTASRYGLPARAVHRGFLIDVLAAALPPGALRLGVSVGGVDEAAEGAVVVRTSAGELRADAVVAADGLRSALRGQLFPRHPGPRYAGETGWRAVLSGAGLPALPAAETWGRGERFGFVPLADGRVYVYATAVTGPGTRPADHRAELIRRFGAWHDPIPALLDRLDRSDRPDRREPDPVTVLHHDFYELAAPLPRFHSGRVALLGDAAHAMTPNLGQGGCQAIEDAVVLAHLLAGDTAVPAALAAYTEARHGRTTRISHRSRRMGDLARLSHPLAVSARNLAVRATPSAVTARGLDMLLGWQPPPGPDPALGSAQASSRSVDIKEEEQQ